MPLLFVRGTYKDGRVELAEHPEGVTTSAPVIVAFLDDPKPEDSADREAARQRAFRRMEQGVVAREPSGPASAGESEAERDEAARRLLVRMESGLSFGDPPYFNREELYEERSRRLDRGDG